MAPVVEESQRLSADNFQERRAQAIAAKAHEIEKVLMHTRPKSNILKFTFSCSMGFNR